MPAKDYWKPFELEVAAIDRLVQEAIPDVAIFILCRPNDIPTDLTFRAAWRLGTVKCPIIVDFVKAEAIHRQRLKAAATAFMCELDHAYFLAKKSQNLPQQVAIERTKIILKTIHLGNMSHCKTVDDIAAFVPQELLPYWSKVCEI